MFGLVTQIKTVGQTDESNLSVNIDIKSLLTLNNKSRQMA